MDYKVGPAVEETVKPEQMAVLLSAHKGFLVEVQHLPELGWLVAVRPQLVIRTSHQETSSFLIQLDMPEAERVALVMVVPAQTLLTAVVVEEALAAEMAQTQQPAEAVGAEAQEAPPEAKTAEAVAVDL
jgi:hypothetical protein